MSKVVHLRTWWHSGLDDQEPPAICGSLDFRIPQEPSLAGAVNCKTCLLLLLDPAVREEIAASYRRLIMGLS